MNDDYDGDCSYCGFPLCNICGCHACLDASYEDDEDEA